MATTHSGYPQDGGAAVAAGDVRVRHAHYYDAALHRAITEAGAETGRGALERAAASAAYRSIAGTAGRDAETEIRGVFESTGLGTIEHCSVGPAAAELRVAPSSYIRARMEMFGKTKAPACDVTRGVLAGSLGALQGRTIQVREVECVAMGAKSCRFVAEPVGGNVALHDLPPFEWPETAAAPTAEAAELVDAGVRALAGPGTGHLWAELYARTAHEFEQEVPRTMGPKFSNLASVVLTEAAHLGTFYSIGGLVRSEDWNARIIPVLPTREDWVGALTRLVASFGWGDWRIQLLAPEQRFTVHVHGGYEALAYLALESEPAATPRCYFARGFVAALMNVLFAGDIMAPAALNQTVYNTLFRSPASFRAIETRCTAMGDPYCEFVANPLSPGMRR